MKSTRWDEKRLFEVSSKYESLKEFREFEKGAYLFALKRGLKDEAVAHMKRAMVPRGYWNLLRCADEAKRYSNRTDFMRGSGSAYNRALAEGWIEKICQHMGKPADGYHHCVYVIVNRRLNKAYIGITKQHVSARFRHHKSEGNTAKSKEISSISDTECFALTDYELEPDHVKNVESRWCDVYKALGFEILNDKRQLGRVGVPRRIYSDEVILREAQKYSRRVDFKCGSPKIYDAAVSQRILSKVCAHMRGIKKKGHWTKEACIAFAKSCSDREEFCKSKCGAYSAALKNHWLDEIYEVLRTRLDMGWLKAVGERVEIWRRADHYYEIWLQNGRCGYWRMRSVTGVNLQKMILKFKSGWVPSEDNDWRAWSDRQTRQDNRQYSRCYYAGNRE
jgi:hypothetical protein